MWNLLFLGLLFLNVSCIRFKVENLSPNLVSKLKLGMDLDTVQGVISNQVLVNVPMQIPTQSGNTFLVDSKNACIKIFSSSGTLEKVIGNIDTKTLKGITYSNFKFGNLGLISLLNEDSFFIQNRLVANLGTGNKKTAEDLFSKYSGNLKISYSSAIPSVILHMNTRGEVLQIYGAKGKNTEPFRYVEAIYNDGEEALFVFHKLGEGKRLSKFKEGAISGEIIETNLDLYQSPESNNYTISLEKMIPFKSGTHALVSFSFISKKDNRFKFRRIYKIAFGSNEVGEALKEIQDPSEILFHVLSNEDFYIWETEPQSNSVKLQVLDSSGNHINNRRLSFPNPRSQWRETYIDSDDKIFSVRVKSGYVEIYEWK